MADSIRMAKIMKGMTGAGAGKAVTDEDIANNRRMMAERLLLGATLYPCGAPRARWAAWVRSCGTACPFRTCSFSPLGVP